MICWLLNQPFFLFEFIGSLIYPDTAVVLIRFITKMSEKPSMRVVFVPKEEPGQSRFSVRKSPIPEEQILEISNLTSRYKLKYGMDFKEFLDARDQVMEHQFDLRFKINDRTWEQGQDILDSELYKSIKLNIKEFLAEAIGNVVSAGFKFLCQKKLGEHEAKEITAKNTLLNIFSIHKQTINAILKHEKINLSAQNRQRIKSDLILEVNNIVENILANLADSYPQAPISGGTLRMRQIITEVSRVEDPENDFIFCNNIAIESGKQECQFFKEEEKDYTRFIMKVINAAVGIAQDSTGDYKDRTMFEKFRIFNEYLFSISENRDLQNEMNSDKRNWSEGKANRLKRKREQVVCQNFHAILSGNEEVEESEKQQFPQFSKAWRNYEDVLIDLNKKKAYAFGHKVPTSVHPFSRKQLQNRQFTAKHSSILRILTKWVDNLQQIFKKPEELVLKRQYPFATINRQLVQIKNSPQGTTKLINQLRTEYEIVKIKFEAIKKASYSFISQFLGKVKDENIVSSVIRFTQIRTISSQISAVLTSLMLGYANILIHHLLKAGQGIETEEKGKTKLNLITFHVSDLMRSKLCCSANGFINLLNTVYTLNDSSLMKGMFNLVRIKNQLDKPANNIMINYLFMGKVQCELQLSIQEPKEKFQNYYTFSHFIYELVRGRFGPIVECGIMISQLDPMIQACGKEFYRQRQKKKEQINNRYKVEGVKINPFFCLDCKKLKMNERNQLRKDFKERVCSVCQMVSTNPIQQERIQPLIQCIAQHRKRKIDKRISYNKEKYWISLDGSGFKLQIIINMENQFEIFSIIVNQDCLKLQQEEILFQNLNYIKIKQHMSKMLQQSKIFEFDNIQDIPDDILMRAIKSQHLYHENEEKKIQLEAKERKKIHSKIEQIVKEFRIFREEKKIIKSIKFKAEIIKTQDVSKWNYLDIVCKKLVLKNEKLEYNLRYRKYNNLDLSNIKKLKASNISLVSLPLWLRHCHNLSILNLSDNKLHNIDKEELPQSLIELVLNDNALVNMDITGLQNIKKINLNHNKLIDFNLGRNNSLVELRIENNCDLQHLNIGQNKSLIELFSSGNSKLDIFSLGVNNSLKKVNLSGCSLSSFSMGTNNSLLQLNLSHNHIQVFSLERNRSLQELDLTENKDLHTIKLKKNKRLKKIFVDRNIKFVEVDQFEEKYIPQALVDVLVSQNLTAFRINGTKVEDALKNSLIREMCSNKTPVFCNNIEVKLDPVLKKILLSNENDFVPSMEELEPQI